MENPPVLGEVQGAHLVTIEEAALTRVERRFAGREASVGRAFAASESFRALCQDYVACADALARWQASESGSARLRSEEYAELLEELTKEIESRLDVQSA
jgi:hypothetical protein